MISTNQTGGAVCSLCGAQGTNKSTCPRNPAAKKPNAAKHNVGAQQKKQAVQQKQQRGDGKTMSKKALTDKEAYFIYSVKRGREGHPYAVIANANGRHVDLYGKISGENYAHLGKISCDKVMIGHDAVKREHGNTILLKRGKSYIYIGEVDFSGGVNEDDAGIFIFHTEQEILDYQSPLNMSGVPYPYAISKDYVYVLGEKVRIPKSTEREAHPNDKLWPYRATNQGWAPETPMDMVRIDMGSLV